MKLTKKNGQMLTKTEFSKKGRDARQISSDERTTALGPFSVELVHAETRCSLRVTLSENFHSVALECSVMIPTPPTPEGVQAGYDWAHDFCTKNLNQKLTDVRRALHDLAR